MGKPVFQQPVEIRSQAAELSPVADDLQHTLEQVYDARRAFDEAFVDKEAAMEGHDQVFVRTARSFEDFLRLAGDNELADRVRPSERRKGRTALPPEGDAQDGENPEGQAPEGLSAEGTN